MPTRKEFANAIRALSMDAVQKANSGHPGAPMGMADMAEVLWNDFLKHNPENPGWWNRDRFVLSNGHASMLLYSLLHLTGYDLSIDDIKNFRQLYSKTPGHPEYRHHLGPDQAADDKVHGVETTTGPLGQGLANAVGMAVAEKMLAAHFNRDDLAVVDHYTYVFLGDGCMMEGISHEACSLAGYLGLGKLIFLYDDNGITIDGPTGGWFTDDTPKRFEAYGWQVITDVDGHNPEAIGKAVLQAREETQKPSLICCKTIIGYGSPAKANSSSCHGAPLGEEEVIAARKELGWQYAPFEIPEEIYSAWNAQEKGRAAEREWEHTLAAYRVRHPELSAEFERRIRGDLPENWADICFELIKATDAVDGKQATRKSSQACLAVLNPVLPEMLGGSADLAGSNGVKWDGLKALTKEDFDANYINYGVREFAMYAVMSGISLHGGLVPYSGTFLVFIDYARNALRMAALMGIRSIYVLTHDSIGVGEDGPTHQPVEHIASLRLIPNVRTWRPADAMECAAAWINAIENTSGPTVLALSRQGLPQLGIPKKAMETVKRGGYILSDCEGTPELILLSTGSEVHLCVEAALELITNGRKVRVVSMPCLEVFEEQDEAYRETVLPADVPCLAVEAAHPMPWYKYTGKNGRVICMDRFGLSAPGGALFAEFGFSSANIVKTAEELLQK